MADEIKALIEAMHTEQYAAMTSKDETQVDKFFDKFYATDMDFKVRNSSNSTFCPQCGPLSCLP